MGIFTKLEQAAASKLKAVFLDAKSLVDSSEMEIASLEAKLAKEKQHVAELAAKAHQAAIVAAEKAKKEAEDLVDEAWQAGQRAAKHAANVPQQVAPTLDPATPQ
jgi:dsDNA-specific endonuclease/ATPase MutS2